MFDVDSQLSSFVILARVALVTNSGFVFGRLDAATGDNSWLTSGHSTLLIKCVRTANVPTASCPHVF